MIHARHALFALIPAALVAQAPDAQAFSQRLRVEAPGVEKLLGEFKSQEARAKAEGLLPAQVASWDESNPQAQMASYGAYRDYVYAYFLAARATDASGDWEKALQYFQKTRDLAKANAVKVEATFPAIANYYKDMAERGRKVLMENADYIQALRAKPNPDAGDLQQLDLVQKEQEAVDGNAKKVALFGGYIEEAKKEADYYARFAGQEEAQIQSLSKSLEEYAFKNDKVKFVEGIVSSKGYLQAQYPDKTARVRFLYRLRTLDPMNRQVVKEIIAETGVQLPLPPEAKPAPRKKKR